MNQWWESIPFFTSAVVIVCGTIYLICLLFGYDSFYEICFLPSAVISQFQGTFMQSDKDDYHYKYVGTNTLNLLCDMIKSWSWSCWKDFSSFWLHGCSILRVMWIIRNNSEETLCNSLHYLLHDLLLQCIIYLFFLWLHSSYFVTPKWN